MTTNDQDKAIEAIMNREGYGSVEVFQTGNPEIIAIRDTDSVVGHFIRDDGAEVTPIDGIVRVLGYPAYEPEAA